MRSLVTKLELKGVKPSRLQRQKRRDKRWNKEFKQGAYTRGYAKAPRNQLKTFEWKLGQENFPKKLSIKFIYTKLTSDYKYSVSYDLPLKRFLKTNVGQNWDKLFAELSQKINQKSRMGNEWIERIFYHVETNTTCINGKVFCSDGTPLFQNRWHGGRLQLYVHPVSRILYRFKKNYYKRLF